LVSVGKYSLGTVTKNKLTTSKLPWYGNRAYLNKKAASEFKKMQDAYGKTIPLESAYRTKDHNTVLEDLYGAAPDSKHMKGLSIDISANKHQDVIDWLKKEGKKYGWKFGTYKGNKGHFNFIGGGPKLRTAHT